MNPITIDPLALDGYVAHLFAPEDPILRETIEESKRQGLPLINISASEGKLLYLLAKMIGAKRVLEIGTLGGYSTIWLARALPAGGKVISLELNNHHAAVARENIERAHLDADVEVRVGPAADSLRAMHGEAPFDIVFIDADKPGYVEYLELSAPLVRPGGLILGDNALAPSPIGEDTKNAVAKYSAAVSQRPDLESVIVPTLRDELDGLVISRKTF